mmetsp:Transcript_1914/g.4533  ORF Transcript_1914/g.4533 Transcript_1914/m.4533 type:complete len:202 (+) Transcript_1914:234-839(+)
MPVMPESIMAEHQQAPWLHEESVHGRLIALEAARHVIGRIPLHAVLCARARIEGEETGRAKAQDGHFGVVHRPVAVGEDTLARPIPVDADGVHGIQRCVKNAQLMESIRQLLLRGGQRHAHQSSSAGASITCTPFLRGAGAHVLPRAHVAIRNLEELLLLLLRNPVRDVVDLGDGSDLVWREGLRLTERLRWGRSEILLCV